MAKRDRYAKMTDDDFDAILQNLVVERAHSILSVPGVYEALKEEWNNDVLEIWEEDNPEPNDEDE